MMRFQIEASIVPLSIYNLEYVSYLLPILDRIYILYCNSKKIIANEAKGSFALKSIHKSQCKDLPCKTCKFCLIEKFYYKC